MWNLKISDGLNKNGYFVIKNYLSSKDLNIIKKANELINYIQPSKEKNLQKKYYKLKNLTKNSRKLVRYL